MFDFIKFLEFGILGLVAICTILSFKLLSEELKKKKAEQTTRPIFFYIGAIAFLAVIAGVFRIIEMRHSESDGSGDEVEYWTLSGFAKKEDSSEHDGIKVEAVPPKPFGYTHSSGAFEIAGVPIKKGEKLALYLSAEGFLPETMDPEKLDEIITYNSETRRAEIRPISLLAVPDLEP